MPCRAGRTALPARRIADTLGVSLRTVYRDIADLQTSGVPIEGEAGVGYLLRKGSDIPPLMFTAEELEALVVGTRFVRAFAGVKLAVGAQSALLKINAVLPAELRGRAERSRVFVPQRWYEAKSGIVDALHEAIAARRVLAIEYRDEGGNSSTREIEPLCLACWGPVWTLGAWCRLRRDFRNFRPDRMRFIATGEVFEETRERGLDAYLATMGVSRQNIE